MRSGRRHERGQTGGREQAYGQEQAYGGERRGRVVVGVNGSLASLAALRTAADEARRSGRRLLAVIAWEPPEGEVLYVRCPDREWADQCVSAALNRLERAFDEAFGGAPHGVDVDRRALRGRPWEVLAGTADGPDDLLVVGAGVRRGVRGGRGVRVVRGGRVVRKLQRRAHCPVLTVPPPSLAELTRRTRRSLRRVTAADFLPGDRTGV
ncbi:universal stress protein [Streptomyces monticola]|uniref:Universal stress protein n=1 Tax=Streptomyces monticola TaxID=2666263 RepID=A0ABW2JAT4_9ACTN